MGPCQKLLDAVIGNADAIQAFEKGSTIYEAYELTSDLDWQFEIKIKESLKSIEQANFIAHKVKAFYSGLYDDLKLIRRIAENIKDFQEKINKHGDDF